MILFLSLALSAILLIGLVMYSSPIRLVRALRDQPNLLASPDV